MDDRSPDDDERLVAAGFADKVRRTLGKVPFTRDAVSAWFCARDPATPPHVKAVIIGALAYFVMPADMVPDFIAGFGYTDDATVFYAAYRTLAGHITDRHRDQAAAFLAGGAADGGGGPPAHGD